MNSPWLRRPISHVLLLAIGLCGLMTTSGCIGLAANMLHAIHGNNRPAEFKGLEGKRVAVVVATEGGISSDSTGATLTTFIQTSLQSNMKKADIVPQDEIEHWLNEHGWSDADYVEIGRGTKADCLLAVDVLNLSLTDGSTLYRGESDITVTVYDIKAGGKILFRKQFPEFAFPSMGGTPVTDTSESRFKAAYMTIVARKVSSLFYEIEATSDFALDATSSRF